MLQKFGSKLRNSAASKKKQPNAIIPSPLRNGKVSPANSPASPWPDLEDDDSLDSYSASHAESLFPLEDDLGFYDQFNSSVSIASSSASYSDENDESKRSWQTSSSAHDDEQINVGPAFLPDFEDAEEQFLEDYEDYFENLSVDNIRTEQYANLDLQRVVHLDYANNPVFSRYQVEEHTRFLLDEAPCSAAVAASNRRIWGIQDRILSLFKTSRDHYALIFTTGTSACFRFLGEAYPFDRSTPLIVCQDAHEQIRHLVTGAAKSGSRATVATLRPSDLCISDGEISRLMNRSTSGVLVLPLQSGLSGSRYSLDWIQQLQRLYKGWHVVLDSSLHLPAGDLDLSIYEPDFVVGSLHHMLGYPAGIGFLLVKQQREFVLKKLKNSRGFETLGSNQVVCEEKGMINALTLAAVACGIEQLEMIGMDRIAKRVCCLANWLHANLKRIKHISGDEQRPMIKLYGSKERLGSILVFNLVDSTGNLFSPHIVKKLGERQNIKLGICRFDRHPLLLGGGRSKTLQAFTAVTASLGSMSNFQDAYRFVQFLLRFRDEEYMSQQAMGYIEASSAHR